MQDKKILVFIPMYNCEKQIPRVLKQFDEATQDLFTEVLIVDNGSKDNSLKAAEESMNKLKNIKTTLVQNVDNYSLGGSHKVAFNYAIDNNFDYVVVLHGDDQGSIQDLVPHVRTGEPEKYDSFLGARFAPGSKLVGYSFIRILGNHALNLFCSLASLRQIYDMGAGLNIYKTEYLKSRFYLRYPNNLVFNVFMLFYGTHVKSSFAYFPLIWREEDQVSNAKIFDVGWKIFTLALSYIFKRKKLFSTDDNEYSVIDYQYKVIAQNQSSCGKV